MSIYYHINEHTRIVCVCISGCSFASTIETLTTIWSIYPLIYLAHLLVESIDTWFSGGNSLKDVRDGLSEPKWCIHPERFDNEPSINTIYWRVIQVETKWKDLFCIRKLVANTSTQRNTHTGGHTMSLWRKMKSRYKLTHT